MKKNILFLLFFLYSFKLFSYECRITKDSNLYGDKYPLSVSDAIGLVKKGSIVSFDTIQLVTYSIDGEENFLNSDYSYFLYVKTEFGKEGYISLLNLSNINNLFIKDELKNYIWNPEYEIDLLKTKDKNIVESNNFFYANYDKWKKYTDWQNEKWYDLYYAPLIIFTDSLIYFSDTETFNGYVCGYITKNLKDTNEIEWLCIESKTNDYSYEDIPSSFVPFFKKGHIYKFKYFLDGDYLNIKSDNFFSYSFVKFNAKTNFELGNLIYPINNNKFNEKNVSLPRHADGTCDYDGSKKTAAVQTVKPTSTTNVTKNETMFVSENLKLRSAEATTSEIITVMSAGTKVKILELGKAENIDGINSNWVKVEVQSGAKDRDGNPIKAGTIGWCYGGYLK
ncbi:MAG: SH3 domain-containing protein [Spirochaetaceae bacterium]|nr:SH3 domain-containing protein [Spirochaetaceae bacterium]